MSDTPRTDAIYDQLGPVAHPAIMAYYSLCRELERENSSLGADKNRLDWLEQQNGLLKFEAEDNASLPHAAVYLPTLRDGESTWRHSASGDDFREAIDLAMRGEQSPSIGAGPGSGIHENDC